MEKDSEVKMARADLDPEILKIMQGSAAKIATLMPKMSKETAAVFKKIQDDYTRIYNSMPAVPKEISKALRKTQEDFARVTKYLPRIPKEMMIEISAMQKNIAETGKMIQQINAHFATPLKELAILSKSVFPLSRLSFPALKPEILERIRRNFFTRYKEEEKILLSLGWWIFPDLPVPYMRQIAKWHNEDKDDQINEAIIEFHEKNIGNILEEWKSNSSLKERLHILIDAIEAHKKEKYTLSVPTLLPQIEWLIVEIIGVKGKSHYGKMLKKLKGKIVRCKEESFRFPLENSLYVAFESLLKVNFRWGSDKKVFGRHPVSHGFFANYDKEPYSLKLILLFHYLQKFLIPN